MSHPDDERPQRTPRRRVSAATRPVVSRLRAPSPTGRQLVWTWIVTRILALAAIAHYEVMRIDLGYYVDQSHAHSLLTGMPEYPFPVAVALMAPARVVPFAGYLVGYIAVALAVDALVTRVLWRRVGPGVATWWVVLVALHGPLTSVRFDVYVAVALLGVLLFSTTKPAASGLAAAAGSAVKLWPAAFAVGLLAPRRRRLTHLIAAVLGGLAWAGLTVAVAGVDRLTSPIRWQGSRGFEIESLWGGLLGLERAFGASVVGMEKRHGSWEYTGALADGWVGVVKPTQYVGYVLVLGLLALGAWAGRDGRRTTAALTMTAVVGAFIASSPVISPQYLVWLVPGLVLVDDASLKRLGAVVLALTTLEFPIMFDGVFSHAYPFEVGVRVVIVMRNVALVWLTARAVMLLLRRVRGRRSRVSSSSTSPATRA